ncbi:hypothetical protein [Ottowia sp.]|uniref:hypothetical protein n=1 Tax=Ottowia sp. TaxID=1898956 RepID=UPI003A8A2947
MARTATKKTAPAETAELLPAVAERMTIGQDLAVAQEKAVADLARQLNYQGSTEPAVLENSAKDAIRRIGMAIFELGGYLLLLKEGCEHGAFLPALERLEVGVDAAQRYMAVTRRFANTATSRHLESAGVSKLVELLPLDDEQTKELAELGQTGELALDDVARMSVKELRAAVRKTRDEKKRLESVNQELNSEVVDLKAARKVVALTDWPDALVPVADQVAAAGRKLAQALSELETCRITLFAKAQDLSGDEQPRFEAALGHVADVYEQALARAERTLARERGTFDQTLGAFVAEV